MGGNSNFSRPMPPTYRGCTVYWIGVSPKDLNLNFQPVTHISLLSRSFDKASDLFIEEHVSANC